MGMLSGNFEDTASEVRQNESRELPRLDEEDEEEIKQLPMHRFVAKDSGKVTLVIENHIFRRRYVRGDLATFTCTGCEKISRKTPGGNKVKKEASAVAQISDDGYLLVQVDEEHKCWDSGFRVKIKEAVEEMYSKIKEDPMRKMPRVYQEVTAKITENLDHEERCALLQEFPTYRAVQSRLYKKKYEFVPRDPEEMKDFDADLPWCTLSSGENFVKGDILLENGKSCFQLTHCWRLLDVTFKITPKLWHQVFVISVQVTSEVCVPVAVFLLLDKMGISYSASTSRANH